MKFLFRKRKKKQVPEQDSGCDRILVQAVKTCLRVQIVWAQWMQRKTKHLSQRMLFLLLLVFISLAGGYNAYLIKKNFSGHQTNAFAISPIKLPGQILQTGDISIQTDIQISSTEYLRIIRFRDFMDSLARSSSGKARYNSIVSIRPGLIDSIQLIEKIYHSQFKK